MLRSKQMEFRILGPLEVWDGERRVDLGGSKRRALLAFLLLHANEVVSTDRLIDQLWGGTSPRNAAAALQTHISRLRKDLGADTVVTRAWGYVLRVDPGAIDLERFQHRATDAENLPARERAEKLREALSLWRGAALADLAFEPALSKDIARLEELHLAVLENRIDADLEAGKHSLVVGELETLVAENPLRERLRGQLILALYRSGRQAEALEVYRETRRLLADELGLEPNPELRAQREEPAPRNTLPPPPRTLRLRPPRPPPVHPATKTAPAHTTTTRTSATRRPRQRSATPTSHTAAAPISKKTSAPTTQTKPAKPARIADDFSDTTIDPLIWQTWSQGTGASAAQQNDQLVFSIAANATFESQFHSVGINVGTKCKFPGNFDARVDYALVRWPAGNGASVSLVAYQTGPVEEISRTTTAHWGDIYNTWPGRGAVALPDTSGSLRLARSNGVLRSYIWHHDQWKQLGAQTISGEIWVGMTVGASSSDWQDIQVSAAFDNFVLTATKADCPTGSQPAP
jgi:DNA-binding SARP family transcriptional activator